VAAVTPSEILLKAAEHLERHGWRQGDYGTLNEPCCAHGAMFAVTDFHADESARIEAKRMFSRFINAPSIDWNDAPGRTANEVIAALRGAANNEESICAKP
jgi:hypothetical protein